MIVLFFGDIFGRPGRKAVEVALPDLKERYRPDFIFGNAENLAGGRGINRRTFDELMKLGFTALTSGNHIWDNKDGFPVIEVDERCLRPANYPNPAGMPCPGRGYGVFKAGDKQIMVVNLMGRVFMDMVDCPFATIDRILAERSIEIPVVVDMHADATSEMYAMGWHLAGRVAAVLGTHSHVQTADERVLPGGTAYITDIGMSGSFDSVIGLRPDDVIRRFITRRPQPKTPARENPGISAVVVRIDPDRRASSIERIRYSVGRYYQIEEKDLEE